MKVIYIAGPIRRGDIWHNVAQADDAMLELMKAGFGVINPMLSCWAGAARVNLAEKVGEIAHLTMLTFPADGEFVVKPDGCEPHSLAHGGFRELGVEAWLAMDLELVRRSDGVLRLPGKSSGADGEVAHANECKVPVFYSVQDVIDWFKNSGGE
jgi:hypothetical protein